LIIINNNLVLKHLHSQTLIHYKKILL